METGFVDWIAGYFWEAMAAVVSPMLAFRLTQFLKHLRRALHVAWRPSAVVWHLSTFAQGWAAASYCLHFKYGGETSLWLGFVVACFAGAIVEFIFRRSAGTPLGDALTTGLYVEDRTRLHTVLGAVTGATVLRERRNGGSGRDEGRRDADVTEL